MRKLLVLAVLSLALVGADSIAKASAESAVESGVMAKMRGVASVRADIRSFPFTGRLLLAGRVSTLDLELDEVVGHGIDVAQLSVRATGLVLDRDVLFGERNVRIRDVDSVRVRATITEEVIRTLTRADVRLVPGRVTVTVAGTTIEATVSVAEGRIRLSVGSLPALTVPAPDADLFPCAIEAVIVSGALEASCTSDQLPRVIIDAVGSVDLER